jgi:nicotinate-nucleotide pyrophosphorylase (carboxylating)
MTGPAPLPQYYVRALIEAAIQEDLGQSGDMTSLAVIPQDSLAQASVVARDTGVCAGIDFVIGAFSFLDQACRCQIHCADGDEITPDTRILDVSGPAAAILSTERVALNFLGHLSGIASETAKLVAAIAGTGARICDTRKTTPGLRMAEKYAVRAGGGVNHRFGLNDAILIKDNHIAVAGSISAALQQARRYAGHMVQIEIEVDRLDQFDEALVAKAPVIMLDNMSLDDMREAVRRNQGQAVLEASGRVSLETVRDIAETGVDYISVGRITHSAPCLDVGLDIDLTP